MIPASLLLSGFLLYAFFLKLLFLPTCQ